jgi:uncharacterized protein
MSLDGLTATEVIARFDLQPLEGEGGHWAPLYRTQFGNAILFLIQPPDFSAWHRIPEDELWVHLAGSPVSLHLIENQPVVRTLGREPDQQLSHLVPAKTWMAARSQGEWSLLVCSLAPPFSEMTLATEEEVNGWRADFPDSVELVEGLLHE